MPEIGSLAVRFTAVAVAIVTGPVAEAAQPTTAAYYPNFPTIIVPNGSAPQAGSGAAVGYSTNVKILNVSSTNPVPGAGFAETPASLACVYGLVPQTAGCSPNVVTANATGGSRAIAIVDFGDYPTALADLQTYSTFFALPAPNLQVVYAAGSRPAAASDGGIEAAIDISMAHALAPNAKIILVEAASNRANDVHQAEHLAGTLVSQAGGGEVSLSFGRAEFPGEQANDSFLVAPGAVYFAATGDSPGTNYPSVSPNVIAVGGTAIGRNPTTGAFEYETAWQDTGGGPSVYVPRPAFQNAIAGIVGTQRGVPDIAAVGDPTTGVWVYDSFIGSPGSHWFIIGGTSVATPVVAAITNAQGAFAASAAQQAATIYASPAISDTRRGSCGPHRGYPSMFGYDFCTGVGSPVGTNR